MVHVILITFVLLAGCSQVSDFDEDKFASALRGDPTDTIRSLESLSSDDVKRMDPEWPMVAALIGQQSGRIDISINILGHATAYGMDSYYPLYAEYLAQLLLEQNRFAEAGKVSSELMRRDPSAKSLFLALQSHYRSRSDAELLGLYDTHESLIGGLGRIERNEVRLMRAVSMLREAHPEWRSEFFSLFVEPLSPGIHYRAYTFIRQRSEINEFSDDERAVMRAMSIASDDEPGGAIDVLPISVMNGTWEYTAPFVDVIGGLFLASRRASEGYDLLQSLPKYEDRDTRSAVGFWVGRLARASGDYGIAVKAFAEVLPFARGTGRSERIRWYLIDTARLIGVEEGIDSLRTHGGSIESASYYSDTFDAILSDAIRSRRWNRVPELVGLIESFGDAASRSRARHIRAALEATGPTRLATVVVPVEGSTASAAEVALGVDNQFYRVSEGEPAISFELTSSSQLPIDPGNQAPGRAVFVALLEIQSYEIAYDLFFEYKATLSRRDYELAALAFDAVGMHTEAMRVFDQFISSRVGDERISLRQLELWFPLAYASIVDAASTQANIPSSLFYSVVREESYFNPKARSRSGALGLSQLMPATAADMASRLGMEAVDLDRPEDNLSIGAAYLGYCIRLFESEILGLVAYNAGLGRVRQWVAQFGDLDFPLFLQAIPFAETRHYVRKVTRALWFYLALYGDIASAAEMPLVLPSL